MKKKLENSIKQISRFFLLLLLVTGCKKLIQIPPPQQYITTAQVFSTDAEAQEAVNGIYSTMINNGGSLGFANGGMTVYGGMSADELLDFGLPFGDYIAFQYNDLTANNAVADQIFWQEPYSIIYAANAAIQNLPASSGVHPAVKQELIAEAEFIRAFCNFYLTSYHGDIPLVTSTSWQNTQALPRTSQALVYQSIITDLKNAQRDLASDFSAGNGERIAPNKWAATALLARVYLYTGDFKDAELQAGSVISNSSYALVPDLNSIFLANSNEAIWQLKQDNSRFTYNATQEGYKLIPANNPFVYLSGSLLKSFETNDQRKVAWIDSMVYQNKTYYYPYKYKIGAAQKSVNGPYTEYYTVLRLGEQYLIRAEAEANGAGSGLAGAIADLNVIRNRAGLPGYAGDPANQAAILNAIYHENQVEFFSEWAHRWLDLKRWGIATTVLSQAKGMTVSKDALLFPISTQELKDDPNLTQNPGY